LLVLNRLASSLTGEKLVRLLSYLVEHELDLLTSARRF
jgi:hypothetical protein